MVNAYAFLAVGAFLLMTALDASFFAHFETSYPWYVRISYRDLAHILTSFRPFDLSGFWICAAVVIAAATAICAVMTRRVPTSILVAVCTPQLLLIPALPWFLFGLPALLGDLLSAGRGTLDTEWLHEGLGVLEALGACLVTPVAMLAERGIDVLIRARVADVHSS